MATRKKVNGKAKPRPKAKKARRTQEPDAELLLFDPRQFPDRAAIRAFVASEKFSSLVEVVCAGAYDGYEGCFRDTPHHPRNALDTLIRDLGVLATAAAQEGDDPRLYFDEDEDGHARTQNRQALGELAQNDVDPMARGHREIIWLASDLLRVAGLIQDRSESREEWAARHKHAI